MGAKLQKALSMVATDDAQGWFIIFADAPRPLRAKLTSAGRELL